MLSGLSILVTRPDPAGTELCELIEQNSGRALLFPTIAFAAPPDQTQYQQALMSLGEQDWLIFVSPQAVYHSVPAIRRQWPEFPASVKFAAIGAGTRLALHQAGYQAVICPEIDWHSEGLLALPDFAQVKGQKIAIIRGAYGRQLLEKAFREQGASITSFEVYERVLPEADTQLPVALINENKISAVICSSFEAVKNLTLLLADKTGEKLFSVPLIVVSERIKSLAEDLGFQTIWIAKSANHHAILDLLARKRNELCQIR